MATEQKLHLETLALHVGQETADPASDARAVPIYAPTAAVGHFGVEDRPWEQTDIADRLKELAGM